MACTPGDHWYTQCDGNFLFPTAALKQTLIFSTWILSEFWVCKFLELGCWWPIAAFVYLGMSQSWGPQTCSTILVGNLWVSGVCILSHAALLHTYFGSHSPTMGKVISCFHSEWAISVRLPHGRLAQNSKNCWEYLQILTIHSSTWVSYHSGEWLVVPEDDFPENDHIFFAQIIVTKNWPSGIMASWEISELKFRWSLKSCEINELSWVDIPASHVWWPVCRFYKYINIYQLLMLGTSGRYRKDPIFPNNSQDLLVLFAIFSWFLGQRRSSLGRCKSRLREAQCWDCWGWDFIIPSCWLVVNGCVWAWGIPSGYVKIAIENGHL